MRWTPLFLIFFTSATSGFVMASHSHFASDSTWLIVSDKQIPSEIDPECLETFDAASQLREDLRYFTEVVSQYAERSQLEFAIRNAERAVARMQCQASTHCDPSLLASNLETVREHLDVVRRLFRENVAFTSEPELFEAFRSMVYSWEALRDSIIL